MKSLFFFTLAVLTSNFALSQTSIYSFHVDSISGSGQINFSAFAGRKILIVNTASQDSSFSQYQELKQLYQIYKDSLVIVVFPTNSFSTENGSNDQIAALYNPSSTNQFAVAAKINVLGQDIHPLYLWLTTSLQNGRMNSKISKPCFKYLIGKNGKLVGVFGPIIRPMSSLLRASIESNN